jgi:hypothetical protein
MTASMKPEQPARATLADRVPLLCSPNPIAPLGER